MDLSGFAEILCWRYSCYFNAKKGIEEKNAKETTEDMFSVLVTVHLLT
jgi:hypothetical protein